VAADRHDAGAAPVRARPAGEDLLEVAATGARVRRSADGDKASAERTGAGARRFNTEDLDEAVGAGSGTAGGLADRLAWFRHGWLGPLAIALTVSLLAVGMYVMLTGGSDAGSTGGSGPGTLPVSTSSATTNPDALAGKALVDGTYDCVKPAATGGTGAVSEPLSDVFIVPPTQGRYSWNGQEGDYTMASPSYDRTVNIIAAVTFTSGPLKDSTANSITYADKSANGEAEATLQFTRGAQLFCTVN
jgi:hypothetical protein